MKIEDFRKLDDNKKVELVNKRLEELIKEEKSTKLFKCNDLEFSYQTATREMVKMGFAREGNEFKKKVTLTERDVMLLKSLAYNYENIMGRVEDAPNVKKRSADTINTTSVRMYTDVWSRWQQFSKEWSIYNSIDLMASALEEYMDKYAFEDIETLKEQGKIKEK